MIVSESDRLHVHAGNAFDPIQLSQFGVGEGLPSIE